MADSLRKLFALIWIALIALTSGGAGVCGEYVLARNSVLLIVPSDMISLHDASIASFGVPDYPGSVVGSVVYPSKGANSCIPFDGDKIFKSNTSLPTILIVDRGECHFAKKVWNAQQAGASAVLIVDYIDEPLLTISHSSSDDRNVDKINIPSAMIHKSFGDLMKKALESKKEVVIKLERPESVRNAICAVLKETTNPPACSTSDIDDCICKNTIGGYNCKCGGNHLYMEKNETATDKSASRISWLLPLLFLAITASAPLASSSFYRYKLQKNVVLENVVLKNEQDMQLPIDDCKEGSACESSECICKNTLGGYDCKCGGNHLYMEKNDTATEKSASRISWLLPLLFGAITASAALASSSFYRYKLQNHDENLILHETGFLKPSDGKHSE